MKIPSKTSLSSGTHRGDTAEMERYTTFFRKYYSSLLFYATRFLDREQAEDVVQDAFMDLWERRDKIEMGEHIRSFMYKSVYTKSINKLKHIAVVNNYSDMKKQVYMKKIDFFSPDNNDITKKLEANEINTEIFKVIELLPKKCGEVFRLSYLHGLKNKEIADTLGISLRTVEAHMYKALKYLRTKLGHLFIY